MLAKGNSKNIDDEHTRIWVTNSKLFFTCQSIEQEIWHELSLMQQAYAKLLTRCFYGLRILPLSINLVVGIR